MNDFDLVMAEKPSPEQQSFKCGKGNFKSNALLKERDNAFALLYKKFKLPDYTGHDHGPGEGVWTAALCPPSIKQETCLECLSNTIPYLVKNCPKQKTGVAWTVLRTHNCMVRYADHVILGKPAEPVWGQFSSPPNQANANANELENGVNSLSNMLKTSAAGGDHLKKFAVGSVKYGPSSHNLYGWMQCTPDIGKEVCLKCLNDATNEMHKCCSRKRSLGGTTLSANCYFWYTHLNF
ncbi:hypothetical protein E3N88_15478 [Mikania micrantha]|uniref:Gnk2-homologous domain-containing protein n=1 Tax=Mikania micrantha TaxID=192012 RepID=A0A5N6NWZ1_9ASTR|nr:hypothetical protein E3N88_15478 [Mikania micrantha]